MNSHEVIGPIKGPLTYEEKKEPKATFYHFYDSPVDGGR
jgi:hypothetical protein